MRNGTELRATTTEQLARQLLDDFDDPFQTESSWSVGSGEPSPQCTAKATTCEDWRPMTSPRPKDPSTRDRLSQQPRRDTSPEVALRKELWRRGYRYSLHRQIKGTRRTIDIALVRHRMALFTDGCFWHYCPKHCSIPKNNSRWWTEKLARNIERDRETDRILKSQGWKVIRVWEHENVTTAANRVERAILSRSTID